MNQETIQEQIDTVKKATEKALQSKEACLEFLTRAGIIELLEEDSQGSLDRKTKQ